MEWVGLPVGRLIIDDFSDKMRRLLLVGAG